MAQPNTKPEPPQTITQVVRLEPSQLQQLERQLATPVVSDKTTELEAGYKLGIQQVLSKLRDGFTFMR